MMRSLTLLQLHAVAEVKSEKEDNVGDGEDGHPHIPSSCPFADVYK